MTYRELSDEQIERMSLSLAQRVRRRRLLGQAAALTLTGVAGAVVGVAVLTAVAAPAAPLAASSASVTCWEPDGRSVALAGEIRASKEQGSSSLVAACAALSDTGSQFAAIAADPSSQLCEDDGRTLIFIGLNESIDCSNPPTPRAKPSQ